MPNQQIVEIAVTGMDCAECTVHVRKAIAALPGVRSVDVFLSSEKAVIQLDPALVDRSAISQAVERAGYSVATEAPARLAAPSMSSYTRRVLTLFAVVFGVVLFVVVAGEWQGLFGVLTKHLPWPIGLAVVLAAGYPIFRNVVRAALRG